MTRFSTTLVACSCAIAFSSCSVLQESTSSLSRATSSATSKIINRQKSVSATNLLNEATALDSAGKHGKAQSAYKRVVKSYPLSAEAPEAAYRRADSLFRTNALRDSFDAYQDFLTTYRGSHHYSEALQRQEEVAHKAADGHIKKSFMGLKSNISPSVVTRMLEQVIANAPQAPSASRAQFKIGEVWDRADSFNRALAGYQAVPARYPSSKFSPQALYNTGNLLVKQSEKGNRNQANIGRAKDAFYDLVNLYPSSKLVPAAKKQIAQLSRNDIQRSFDTAQFYEKKGQNTAAVFYYKEVLNRAKSGSLHDQAKQRIASLTR